MTGLIEVVAGILLALIVFYDMFQSVVLPRPAVNKFALVRFALRRIWRVWRWIGNRMSSVPKRESFLAAFGPVGVLLMFAIWGLALVLAFALMMHGVRDQIHPALESFGSAVYFSASTLVPLSYGDYVPEGLVARLATIGESATGVFLAALAITLLFSLYQAFQRREELVVSLDAMAGAPPSGVQILENVAEHRLQDELINTFDDWRAWAAAVLESHLAYPILLWFRSSHDNEAWVNSFGAVMDAATLVISIVDDKAEGPARLMFTVGNHLVEDLARNFRYLRFEGPLVEREEFEQAWARLQKAGYRCHGKEGGWEQFSKLRAKYASPLNQLAHQLAIIPAQWIGDRSYLPHRDSAQIRRRIRGSRG